MLADDFLIKAIKSRRKTKINRESEEKKSCRTIDDVDEFRY